VLGALVSGCTKDEPTVAAFEVPDASDAQVAPTVQPDVLLQPVECASDGGCPLPVLTFKRTCTGDCVETCMGAGALVAETGPFSLDALEVTVARFRRFVDAFDGWKPAVGSGANPSNGDDHGWQAAWSQSLPASAQALTDQMQACGGHTWAAADAGTSEQLPINCASWYVAQAFCIWDGGRLPTEAEWSNAASGGEQQRVYPWAPPPAQPVVDPSHAVYDTAAPLDVGQKAAGRGRWGQWDLAGNVAEWVLDAWKDCPPSPCNNCAVIDSTGLRVVRGGGFTQDETALETGYRTNAGDAEQWAYIGLRCARQP
jgi:formylglycine-generating enzyme required for sulfatase activity